MMKKYTTIKVGYTAGIYGCSGEYFTTIVLTGDDVNVFNYSGRYGAEERVGRALNDAGYNNFYTPSDFGKMTMSDVRARKNFWLSEYTAIDAINEMVKTK